MILAEHTTTMKMTFINTATILAFMQKAIPDIRVTNRQIVTKAEVIVNPLYIYRPVRWAELNLNVVTVSVCLQVCNLLKQS